MNGHNQPQYNNLFDPAGYPIGEISYFSSPGPTRDGRAKPDIYAPGAWIASSLSAQRTAYDYYTERDGKHYNSRGTSLSAPHVTGAIALLLEQNPLYTVGDVKQILQQSAVDGKLDIYAALDVNEEPVGVEDDIVANGPTVLEQNSSVTFTGTFYDYPPTGDYIVGAWSWELRAYHDQGAELLASGSSYGSTQTSWTCSVPDLSNWNNHWVWDNNYRIAGYVYVETTDNDGVLHTDKLDIGINALPESPIIWRSEGGNGKIELSFIAGGATGYKVYYDTDSGIPYDGTDANQGSSPIDVGSSTNITLTGLNNGTTYYLAVKAYNNTGESDYSSECYATPITTSGTLAQNETWPGAGNPGTISITGDVIIPSGKILTIQPGATVTFATNSDDQSEGSDPNRCELIINGKLIAEGTSFDSITFQSANGGTAKNQWYGIRFSSTADNSSIIQYATIKNARYGIYLSSGRKPTISHNTIAYNTYGIYGNNPGSINITYNTI